MIVHNVFLTMGGVPENKGFKNINSWPPRMHFHIKVIGGSRVKSGSKYYFPDFHIMKSLSYLFCRMGHTVAKIWYLNVGHYTYFFEKMYGEKSLKKYDFVFWKLVKMEKPRLKLVFLRLKMCIRLEGIIFITRFWLYFLHFPWKI